MSKNIQSDSKLNKNNNNHYHHHYYYFFFMDLGYELFCYWGKLVLSFIVSDVLEESGQLAPLIGAMDIMIAIMFIQFWDSKSQSPGTGSAAVEGIYYNNRVISQQYQSIRAACTHER
jgi:hypothetical protein